MGQEKNKRIYRIGDLSLNTATHEVRRGRSTIELPQLSYGLLVLLVERAPAVVTHEEIMRHVWSGLVVAPATVTQRVKLLRSALDDDAQHPRYIKLVRGVGYRLVAEVDSREIPGARDLRFGGRLSFPARYRENILAFIGVAAIAVTVPAILFGFARSDRAVVAANSERSLRPQSIAVLPFDDVSVEGLHAGLGQGVADDLMHRLRTSRDLQVISSTSSFALWDEGLGAPEIAERLGARYILHGSIRQVDGNVEITAQLIDAHGHTRIWSAAYDRAVDDLLSIQNDIANELSQTLAIRLNVGPAGDRAPDPSAYRHYVTGMFFFNRRGSGDMDRAEENFNAALEIDPDLARAWVGLAGVHYIRRWEDKSIDYQSSIDMQRWALENALALDPELVDAHVRLSNLYWQMGDPEKAEAHLARIEETGSNSPLFLARASGMAAERGDFDKAADLYREVVARDPLSGVSQHNLAMTLLAAGRLEEADAEMNRVMALNASIDDEIRWGKAAIRVLQGSYHEALELIDDTKTPDDRAAIMAMAYAGLGRHEESEAMLDRLQSMRSANAIARVAEVRKFLGDRHAARRALSSLENLKPGDSETLDEIYDALTDLIYSPFLNTRSSRHDYRERLVRARSDLISAPRG